MSQARKILIVGSITGYQTRVFAETARHLGMDVILATDQCHQLDDPWGDDAVTVRFERPEQSARVLERAGRAQRVNGIVAVGDQPTYLAALTAERLGLPYGPPAAVAACRDKFLMRQYLQAAGLRVPGFLRLKLPSDPKQAASHVRFPCVLKPIGLSGSRGVIRANSHHEFIAAFERIRAILESLEIRRLRQEHNRYIQAENYIEGREFALEGVVRDGSLQTFAIFDKPDPLDGPFFEETIYVTPSREEPSVQQELIRTAQEAIRALGLKDGPVHAEMRANRQGVWILEIAARPIGGLCARALRFDGGLSLEELLLRRATGEDVSKVRLSEQASGVMMIPIPEAGIYEDVEGIETARASPGVEDVLITAKRGQKLVPLPEGSSYLGFIFARESTPERAEFALREAHGNLKFRIAKTLAVFNP